MGHSISQPDRSDGCQGTRAVARRPTAAETTPPVIPRARAILGLVRPDMTPTIAGPRDQIENIGPESSPHGVGGAHLQASMSSGS